MKNLKSLQVVALAGLAIAFTSGCSSTGYSENTSTDENAAYRWVSSGGWTPLTDVRQLGKFPIEWNPVAYETYMIRVPIADQSLAMSSSTSLPSFSESLEPGDAFVEAAGAEGDSGQAKRVVLYSPFGGTGLGH